MLEVKLHLFIAEVMHSYLFLHEGIKEIPIAERTMDSYWKGIITGIRQVPSSSHKKSKVHSFLNLINLLTNCPLVYASSTCEVVFFIRAHSRGVWDEYDTS
jgi:hypothetical protein